MLLSSKDPIMEQEDRCSLGEENERFSGNLLDKTCSKHLTVLKYMSWMLIKTLLSSTDPCFQHFEEISGQLVKSDYILKEYPQPFVKHFSIGLLIQRITVFPRFFLSCFFNVNGMLQVSFFNHSFHQITVHGILREYVGQHLLCVDPMEAIDFPWANESFIPCIMCLMVFLSTCFVEQIDSNSGLLV